MTDIAANTPQELTPVTLWSRKNEKKEWEYNHLEDGHVPEGTQRPTPKHANHKSSWKSGDWQPERAYLNTDTPPKVVRP